jgi:hypothetical protein
MTTVLSRGSPAEFFEIPFLVTPRCLIALARGLALPVSLPELKQVYCEILFRSVTAIELEFRVSFETTVWQAMCRRK